MRTTVHRIDYKRITKSNKLKRKSNTLIINFQQKNNCFNIEKDMENIIIEEYGISVTVRSPKHYIYCITNNACGKRYIGQTKNIKQRIENHLQGKGSKDLLKAIVTQSLSDFSFEILEMLYANENVDEIEDKYIHELDTLHPADYNRRINKQIQINDETINLDNIPIQAKFCFDNGEHKVFSIGEFSQSRAYQLLTNIKAHIETDKVKQKKLFKFNYFELRVFSKTDFVDGQVYDLVLKYKFNDDEFNHFIL